MPKNKFPRTRPVGTSQHTKLRGVSISYAMPENLLAEGRAEQWMQQSSAEASWGMSELQKFEQTGPEMAFQMSSRDLSTQADLSAVIRDHLSRFVEMSATGVSPSTAPTSITITSAPAGAEIYVDNDFVGNTLSTVNVQSGRHSICVKKAGFRDWVREMNLSGGTITLVAELVPSSDTQP